MIRRFNSAAIFALIWSLIFFIICVNMISQSIDMFICNLIMLGGVLCGLFILGYRLYIFTINLKLDIDEKKINIKRQLAEIESIKSTAALPHHYRASGVLGVTPTPSTPQHPPEPEQSPEPDKKIPVFKDGRVVFYARKDKHAIIANMYFAKTPDGRRKHTITDIAIAAFGAKGGWQNGKVKEIINEIKDIYSEDI